MVDFTKWRGGVMLKGFGLWFRFKEGGKWGAWQWNPDWNVMQLLRVRGLVSEYLGNRNIGFVPRTVAVSIATDVGIEMPSGVDGAFLSYAFYLRVQVANGAYEDGPPGEALVLPNVFTEVGKKERVRKVK